MRPERLSKRHNRNAKKAFHAQFYHNPRGCDSNATSGEPEADAGGSAGRCRRASVDPDGREAACSGYVGKAARVNLGFRFASEAQEEGRLPGRTFVGWAVSPPTAVVRAAARPPLSFRGEQNRGQGMGRNLAPHSNAVHGLWAEQCTGFLLAPLVGMTTESEWANQRVGGGYALPSLDAEPRRRRGLQGLAPQRAGRRGHCPRLPMSGAAD